MLTTRLFRPEDAEEVARIVATTLRITNSKDYSEAYIEGDIQRLTPAFFIQKATQTHFYVFIEDNEIVGTGAIGPYWDSKVEYSLFTIFVHLAYQGHGLGRHIIETLEADVYFKHATRVEIPASITAVNFYRKMGYDFKGGNAQLDEELLYRLEKFPTAQG